jgi:hypothetical protein
MDDAQPKLAVFRKGDITFLLDIVQAILPVTSFDWYEVAEVYNSGVSAEHMRSSAALRTQFRVVRLSSYNLVRCLMYVRISSYSTNVAWERQPSLTPNSSVRG